MDDLSLRVYLENGSDAMRGGWLELPVVPERLDAFMRGVVGVDDGGGYAVVDHEPGWFGDVLGSDLESFSVSSLNLAARCVAHARDLAVADSVDGDVFLDMLATAAESEDVRFPSGIAALAARASELAGMMSVAADRAAADGRRRMAPPLTFYRLRSDWEAWHGPDDGGWRSEDCSVWLAAVLLHDMGLEPSVVYAEADPEAMF